MPPYQPKPGALAVIEAVPPPKLWLHEVGELLDWYLENLCKGPFTDPRGHEVWFREEHFVHMIKLLNPEGKEIAKPVAMRITERIRSGELKTANFGGWDLDRSQTLTWIPEIITNPTQIVQNPTSDRLLRPTGGEVYVREFARRDGYKRKALICYRKTQGELIPVTSFPWKRKVETDTAKIIWEPE